MQCNAVIAMAVIAMAVITMAVITMAVCTEGQCVVCLYKIEIIRLIVFELSKLIYIVITAIAITAIAITAIVECIPIVAETLGGLAEDAIFTVRFLGRAIADRTGSMDPISTTRHIFQRFAIALWRGNACLWLHRHPTLPSYLDGVA